MDTIQKNMIALYEKEIGPITSFEWLSAHASTRRYARISGATSCIASYGEDVNENRAFVQFGLHLKNASVSVPEIYAYTKDYMYYLQEDVGNQDFLSRVQTSDDVEKIILLKQAVDTLIPFQYNGHEGWDYSHCYGFSEFDENEIQRNFSVYRKRFLDVLAITYDETLLSLEIKQLIQEVNTIPKQTYRLMHRDFQGRNIMAPENNELYIIDYQGSRLGPVEYDLASLIFQSKGKYTESAQEEIMQYYMRTAPVAYGYDVFEKNVYILAIVRMFQALGSYGIAGLTDKKEYFITSIPLTARNVIEILEKVEKKYGMSFSYFKQLQTKTLEQFSNSN